MNRFMKTLAGVAFALAGAAPALAEGTEVAVAPAFARPAERSAAAAKAMLLGATRAGQRLVAVGERGTVLLSDDEGRTWRQATAVPVQATLTGVSFVDARNGWAVGHWGVVLHTRDGGDTWALQRRDVEVDQPLLAVQFVDAQRGLAVGLWSLMLRTEDGGATWQPQSLPRAAGEKKTDLNLYGLFAGPDGALYAAAEQGRLLRTRDVGTTWEVLDTGYRGSLWTGLALPDGTLLVGGLRGTVLRSADGGQHWQPGRSDARSSVTGLARLSDGSLVASALDGVALTSSDGGASFVAVQRADRLALTGVIVNRCGQAVLLSREGPVPAPVCAADPRATAKH